MVYWKTILSFLKHKMIIRRRKQPGQKETDAWLKSKNDTGVLPKIAKYRFPFKPIVQEPLKTILGKNKYFNQTNKTTYVLILIAAFFYD